MKLSVETLYLCTTFPNRKKRPLPRVIESLIGINKNLDETGIRNALLAGCLGNNHLGLLGLLEHTQQDNQAMHLSLF